MQLSYKHLSIFRLVMKWKFHSCTIPHTKRAHTHTNTWLECALILILPYRKRFMCCSIVYGTYASPQQSNKYFVYILSAVYIYRIVTLPYVRTYVRTEFSVFLCLMMTMCLMRKKRLYSTIGNEHQSSWGIAANAITFIKESDQIIKRKHTWQFVEYLRDWKTLFLMVLPFIRWFRLCSFNWFIHNI